MASRRDSPVEYGSFTRAFTLPEGVDAEQIGVEGQGAQAAAASGSEKSEKRGKGDRNEGS